ncbi:MAG: protein kinase [Acidobacteriota bacterium]
MPEERSETGIETVHKKRLGTLAHLALEGADALFECQGDTQACQTIVLHDALVRDLLHRFHGCEIEKTRRFLILFERPVDAVAFALTYHEAVKELAIEGSEPVAGRIGLHLGEVFTWENPSEHVARGAKRLEVEGPARTSVARVLSLARGGQTLLTQAAFDLARRAAVGDAALPSDVEWVSHGPYRFSDEEKTVEVYEVGVEGTALLQAPRPEDLPGFSQPAVAEAATTWSPTAGEPVPHRPNWRLERSLGAATYGKIWLAKHRKTGDRRAFRFCTSRAHLPRMQHQLEVVRHLKASLDGAAVAPRAVDSQLDATPYFLESEHVESDTLSDWAAALDQLADVSLVTRLEIVAQLAELLALVHASDVALGNLRPGSILVREAGGVVDQVLMADLSQARLASEEPNERSTGPATAGHERAVMYLAPELEDSGSSTQAGDVYALGILLYQLTAGDLARPLGPFWQRDVSDEKLQREISGLADPEPSARSLDTWAVARRLRDFPGAASAVRDEQETSPDPEEAPLRGPRLFRRLLGRRRQSSA